MGREATCDARLNRRALHGRALLETNELVFRGDASLKIPFADMKGVVSDAGRLRIRFGGESFPWSSGRPRRPGPEPSGPHGASRTSSASAPGPGSSFSASTTPDSSARSVPGPTT